MILDDNGSQKSLGGKIVAASSPQQAGKIAAARRTFTPAAPNKDLADALGVPASGEPAAVGVPYPKPAASTGPAQPNVIGEIFSSPIARSVVRSVAVNVAGTITRSLLGAMGVRGRR